jgi:hypothetical protein
MRANKETVIHRAFFFLFAFYIEFLSAQNRFFSPFLVKEFNLPKGSVRFSIGDFNGDGFPDIAVISQRSITLIKNKQNFDFDFYFSIPTKETPSDIKISDIDNDGEAEIIVVYKASSTIEIFKSDTSGFRKMISFETGIYPEMLICSDIDLNGLKDIVTTGKLMLGVTVNYQNNLHRFSTPVNFFPKTPIKKAQILDLNYDDVPDLVGIDWLNNALLISYGRGDGKFGRIYTYGLPEEPTDFYTVDLNGDGFFDYIIAFYYLGEVQFFYTTQSGITTRFKFKAPKPTNVCASDVNLDGLKDVVVSNDKGFFIFLNAPAGFEQYNFVSEGISQIECGDLNADGKDEIVVLDSIENKLKAFRYVDKLDASKDFSIAVAFSLSDFSAADFDRDDYVDFAFVGQRDSSILLIYSENEKFSLFSNQIDKAFTDVKVLSVSDLNYLFCTNYETGDVSLFRFKGRGRTREIFKYNFDKPRPIFIGLGQEGAIFLFLSVSDSNLLIIKPNDESSFDEFTIKELDSMKVIASSVGDFNSDGYLDVAVITKDINGVKFSSFLRTEKGREYKRNYSANLNVLINRAFLFVDDFTGDSFVDILAYHDYSTRRVAEGEINLFINDGTGKFRRRKIDTHIHLASQKLLKIADFTGDMKKDFVIFDKLKGKLYLYINDGGSFNKKEIGNFKNINRLGVTDINRDGAFDLILLNEVNGTINFLLNKGGEFK